ncbi:MAG: fasciclin domain-containing protein [Nitrososphaerota archaeon]|jgi:uncharacterized surface protein with fasciclin (FAS1) repeats|nr:fasciclin domain-containing protein [Nitrososphaerota archaeon]MDG6951573.1 fasciclin domain-containing protein [Nitrososphaerota archaeon]
MQDIVNTAVSAGNFKTLVAAVQAAGLVQTLKSPGPFTVFAPTDAAFSALPKGTVEGLLKDVPKLTSILTYHVVPGRVSAAEVMKMVENGPAKVKSVQGESVTLSLRGVLSKHVYANDAKVIQADIGASNGVIHVIDKVIMPGM